ncbi:contactin-associated protein-like 5 [Exaiptasia diaphana]|uniref:F5/8 type C domain-containing protein n=1 Tax=Exaiptasia diaphana TaxID=2652724 RepID=A0A913YWB3_EXADI|nr:contactin-associated protein-like 5 [Exaiptasia diaphana]
MESKTIPNYRIVASSFLSNGHAPWRGRLNARPQMPYDASIDAAAWQASHRKAGEYLQVDLGSIYEVPKVATQGRPHMHSAWVSSYSLSYAVTNGNFIDYKVHGALKVFPGNFDRDTIVTNKLPVTVRFRYIRFVVVTYSDIPAMRAEIFGC